MRRLLFITAFIFVPPAFAQTVTIDPGMTRAQVVERLGKPATERSSGGFTYMFYVNGCERTCGMNDLITLSADTVIDAIFRAKSREYTGRSTSPNQGYSAQPTRTPLKLSPGAGAPVDSVVVRIRVADPVTEPVRPIDPVRPDSTRPPGGAPPPATPVRPVSPPPPPPPR